MKTKKSNKVLLAALLVVAMLCSLLMPIASAARPAGNDGYISLHQYVVKTDDPDVYKVQMHINVENEPTTFDVVFMLDASEKMMQVAGPGTKTHFEHEVDAAYKAASVLLDASTNPHGVQGANMARVFFLFYNGGLFGIDPGAGARELIPANRAAAAGASLVSNATSGAVAYFADGEINNVNNGGIPVPTALTREFKDLRTDLNAVVADSVNATGTLRGSAALLSNNDTGLSNAGSAAHTAVEITSGEEHYSAAALAGAYEIFAAYSNVEDSPSYNDLHYDANPSSGAINDNGLGPDEYLNTTSEPTQRKIALLVSADRDYEVRDPLDYVATPLTAGRTPNKLEPYTIAQEGSLRAEALAIAKALKLEVHNKDNVNSYNAALTWNGDTSLIATNVDGNVAKKGHEARLDNAAVFANNMNNTPAYQSIRYVGHLAVYNSGTDSYPLIGGISPSNSPWDPITYSTSSMFPVGGAAQAYHVHGGTLEYAPGSVTGTTNAHANYPYWVKISHHEHDTWLTGPLASDVNYGNSAYNYQKTAPPTAVQTIATPTLIPVSQQDHYVSEYTSPLQDAGIYNTIQANGGMGAEIWNLGYDVDESTANDSYDDNNQRLAASGERHEDAENYYTDIDMGAQNNATFGSNNGGTGVGGTRHTQSDGPSYSPTRPSLNYTSTTYPPRANPTGQTTIGNDPTHIWYRWSPPAGALQYDGYASYRLNDPSAIAVGGGGKAAAVPASSAGLKWHNTHIWNEGTLWETVGPSSGTATGSGAIGTDTVVRAAGSTLHRQDVRWPAAGGSSVTTPNPAPGTDHSAYNGVNPPTTASGGGTPADGSIAQYLWALGVTNEDDHQGMIATASGTDNLWYATQTFTLSRVGWLTTTRTGGPNFYQRVTEKLTTDGDTGTSGVGPWTVTYYWRWYEQSATSHGSSIINQDRGHYFETFQIDFSNQSYAEAIKETKRYDKSTTSSGLHSAYDPTDYKPVVEFSKPAPQMETALGGTSGLIDVVYQMQMMIYNLYKVPGGDAIADISKYFDLMNPPAPKISYTTVLPDYVVQSGGGMTASTNGNKLTWNLTENGGIYATVQYVLEFEIKMHPDLDPTMHYPVEDRVYIMNFDNRTLFRHKEKRGNYVRYTVTKDFPMKYIQGNGVIVELDDAPASETQTNNLLWFFAMPYDKVPKVIEDVKVEEMTVEQIIKEVVDAGTIILAQNKK